MLKQKAKKPFTFCERFHLTESTGQRASTLNELLALLKEVPGACIYHHTHRSLQQHEYLSPEPPNDFAYWITDALGEEELGEKVASIDIIQFGTIRALRDKIIETISGYLAQHPEFGSKPCSESKVFFFLKSVSFIAPTRYQVNTLAELADRLENATLDSVYFHIFEARLRLENESNDFSNWIESSLGRTDLAEAIARLDPYTYALDDLRKKVVRIIREARTEGGPHGSH